MEKINVKEYLTKHRVNAIKVGQSGADVYDIDGKYILKHVIRQNLSDKELFDTYAREILFYQSRRADKKIYLPEIHNAEISDNEIIILMKKYDVPKRSEINPELIKKITASLAALHTDEIPDFMNRDKAKAEMLSEQMLSGQQISQCLCGWQNVLSQHPGAFDVSPLEGIAARINNLITWHDSEERVLVHGDFHWDNLLKDETGNILLCDWQSVGFGGASGDLSFFLSRLGSDGIHVDRTVFLDFYADAIQEISGKQTERKNIMRHMDAANVITSFVFWHQYLHGSSEERVRDIYGNMTESFNMSV